jgi:small subunit ribosomal protein S6
MLLLRPDLEEDKLQSAVERVTRAIVNQGGTLTKVSPWGKRRLAYDIQHQREASYFLIHFDIEPSAIREIERGLLISEEILRHLVTLLEEREGETAAEALSPESEVPRAAAPRDGAIGAAQPSAPGTQAAVPSEPDPMQAAGPEQPKQPEGAEAVEVPSEPEAAETAAAAGSEVPAES